MDVTICVLIATVFILIIYDVWAACKFGDKGTISWVIQYYSRSITAIAFAFGIVMGHLFWPNCGPEPAQIALKNAAQYFLGQ